MNIHKAKTHASNAQVTIAVLDPESLLRKQEQQSAQKLLQGERSLEALPPDNDGEDEPYMTEIEANLLADFLDASQNAADSEYFWSPLL